MSHGLYVTEHVRLFVKRLLFQLNLFSPGVSKHDRARVLARAESSDLPSGRTQRTPDVVMIFQFPVTAAMSDRMHFLYRDQSYYLSELLLLVGAALLPIIVNLCGTPSWGMLVNRRPTAR